MSRTIRLRTPTRRSLWLGLLLVVIVVLIAPGASLAQDKTLYWERYDTNIAVEQDGDILVEEIQDIVFTSGTFRFGFAEIPLNRIEQIADVSVLEITDGQEREYTGNSTSEYGFITRRSDNNQEIKWFFPPTRNTAHTYVLRYRVKGGLRVYDDYDQVWWKAIPAGHNFPIRSATVTVTPPQTFPRDQLDVDAYGVPVDTISYTDNGDLVLKASDIPAGDELEVSIKFPTGVVQAGAPAWQEADDLRRGWGSLVGLLSVAAGLFLLVGGPIGVYLLWQRRGRHTEPDVVPDYLTEPPSSLPAGLVGTLVDEYADFKDIIASMFDLAQRGVIRMGDHETADDLRFGRGFVFYLEKPELAIYPHEQRLLLQIFGYHPKIGVGAKERTLDDLRLNFHRSIPQLKQDLYQGVVEEGLFRADPHKTRKYWYWLAIAGLAVVAFGAFLLHIFLGHLSAAVVLPPLGLVPGLVTLAIVSRHMPQKTAAGAEAAAKWLAFKRYLQTIEQHTDLKAVNSKFQEYFPYAVVFGLQNRLIHKFSKAEAPVPTWWEVVIATDEGHLGLPVIPGPGTGLPERLVTGKSDLSSLAGMSESLGMSLAKTSDGLGTFLNSAASSLEHTPTPTAIAPLDGEDFGTVGKVAGVVGTAALIGLDVSVGMGTGSGGGGGGGGGSRGFG